MRLISARALSAATLACTVALSTPAFAAADYYLKIKGIDGETTKGKDHKDQIEILSYSWGETRAAGKVSKVDSIAIKQGTAASGGVSVAAGDVTGDGAAAKHKSGSLTYLNRTRQKELLMPAASGSVTLVAAAGHGLCTPGRGLGHVTLRGKDGRDYVLKGVTVAGCDAVASGGDRPMESISLNYTKIE